MDGVPRRLVASKAQLHIAQAEPVVSLPQFPGRRWEVCRFGPSEYGWMALQDLEKRVELPGHCQGVNGAGTMGLPR